MVCTALLDSDKGSKSSSSSNDSNQGVLIVAAVAFVLYMVSEYIILWLSRVREYYADEFSAEVTRNPSALASALVNIGFGLSTHAKRGKKAIGSASGESTLGIFDTKSSKSMVVECFKDGKIDKDRIKNSMKWELWNPWAFFYELSSTHPLISKRIKRLDEVAAKEGEEAFVNFDLEKPRSYMGNFVQELLVSALPIIAVAAAAVIAAVIVLNGHGDDALLKRVLGGVVLVGALASIGKYLFTHPRKNYHEANVAGLLGEVDVSMIRSIPCELTGKIIGRGDPGSIFSEDVYMQDETGIMFLDYNQPLWIVNKLIALLKVPGYIGKDVTVHGWYRRGLVPFVEVYTMEIDGKTKKAAAYGFGWAWRIALAIAGAGILVASLAGIF